MADLTTVARVKQYAPLANTPNLNSKLVALVSAESATLLQYLDIACPFESHSEFLDGLGQTRLTLPRQPVIAVSALSINGVALPRAAQPTQAGFMVDRSGGVIIDGGSRFPRQPMSIECTWEAGFAGSKATTIPAASGNATVVSITPSGADVEGGWAAQANVVAAQDGSIVFAAASNALNPQPAEYGLEDGVFYFNSSNSNLPVLLTYYPVPGPLMQATNVMVSLALQQAVNIGVAYKNILGEGIRYETTQLNDDIKAIVAAYRRVTPA